MSQTLSDRLSIDQIARLWAAENEKAAFGAEDIAADLVNAAELGEFEHTIYARTDAPLGKYTYREDWEDDTSKALEGKQPYVGPYRSALSTRDVHQGPPDRPRSDGPRNAADRRPRDFPVRRGIAVLV